MFLHLCSSNLPLSKALDPRNTDHHDLSDSLPFSVRFVCMSSIPLRFTSGPKKRPMTWRESSCIFCFIDGIRNTHNSLSTFYHHTTSLPTDMKMIRPWTSSGSNYFSHHVLNLNEDLQCSESWEIFHSNSIGAPSIRSNSLYWSEFWSQSIFSFQALTGFWPIHNTESDSWVFAFDNWTAFFSKQNCPLPSLLLPVDHV